MRAQADAPSGSSLRDWRAKREQLRPPYIYLRLIRLAACKIIRVQRINSLLASKLRPRGRPLSSLLCGTRRAADGDGISRGLQGLCGAINLDRRSSQSAAGLRACGLARLGLERPRRLTRQPRNDRGHPCTARIRTRWPWAMRQRKRKHIRNLSTVKQRDDKMLRVN